MGTVTIPCATVSSTTTRPADSAPISIGGRFPTPARCRCPWAMAIPMPRPCWPTSQKGGCCPVPPAWAPGSMRPGWPVRSIWRARRVQRAGAWIWARTSSLRRPWRVRWRWRSADRCGPISRGRTTPSRPSSQGSRLTCTGISETPPRRRRWRRWCTPGPRAPLP